jgi:hypothetical protein
MKILCLILLFTFTVGSCFGQTTKSTNTKNDYLKKARNQKTAAKILAVSGIVVGMVGFGVAYNNLLEDAFTGEENASGAGAVITGAVMVAGSVPLLIASGRNRRKAFLLSIKNEKMHYPYKTNPIQRPVPSLSLSMHL